MSSANGPVHVSDSEFEKIVLNSKIPVLVDFWAAWCGPCRMIAPYVEELAKEYGENALIAKMDTDANPQTPMKYGIMGIPTLIIFKDGKELDRQVGVPRQPKQVLKSKLDSALAAPVKA
jgi:thioredoxin 1